MTLSKRIPAMLSLLASRSRWLHQKWDTETGAVCLIHAGGAHLTNRPGTKYDLLMSASPILFRVEVVDDVPAVEWIKPFDLPPSADGWLLFVYNLPAGMNGDHVKAAVQNSGLLDPQQNRYSRLTLTWLTLRSTETSRPQIQKYPRAPSASSRIGRCSQGANTKHASYLTGS